MHLRRFRCGGRLHFSHRRSPQPAGPGQSHVLRRGSAEQPDRCQTGHRQRKSALKTALTKADKGFLEARRAVTAGPRRGPSPTEPASRGSHPTDQPSGHRTWQKPPPSAAGAFAGAGWHNLLQELPRELLRLLFSLQAPCRTGWRPTRRLMPTPSCWSLLCGAGYHPGSRAVRRAFCHPADSPGQRAGMGAALP